MPPRFDLRSDQQTLSTELAPNAPITQQTRDILLIQRALAQPSPQTLTPSVLSVLRQSYGSAFVQRLMRKSTPRDLPPTPTTESLESFLARMQSARANPAAPIQAKLTVTPAGDPYEQEADAVAHQVVQKMNAPIAPKAAPVVTMQRQPDKDEDEIQREEEEDKLQTKPDLQFVRRQTSDENKDKLQTVRIQRQSGDLMGGLDVAPDVESRIQAARGGGSPIADGARTKLESAFGADFGSVRVHTDSESDVLNRSVQARAFTTGRDIFFRQGEYNPGSAGGQELLAHELTHVVQQGGSSANVGRVLNPIQRSISAIQIKNSTVNSVSYDTSSRVGIFSGGQHTTAYVLFCQTIRNQLLGQTVDDALDKLTNLLQQFTYLPTYQGTTWTNDPNTVIQNLQNKFQKAKGKNIDNKELMGYANEVIDVRNSLDRSSYANKNPTHSGVTEGNEAGILQVTDDKLRRGEKATYDVDTDVYTHLINLFHFDPGSKVSEEELAALIIQHVYSSSLAFPHIPEVADFSLLAWAMKNDQFQIRTVNSDKYDWTQIYKLLDNYLNKKEIPQYKTKTLNKYDKIIGNYGYTLK
jgi:hypothetical protein